MKSLPPPTSPILEMVARLCFYPGLLFSIYLLYVGHNMPGGGFIAGLTALSILVLQMMAFGYAWRQNLLDRWSPLLAGGGLLLAAITGAGALLLGYPFLTSAVSDGGWSTAFFFDLGVYGVVVGSGLMILRMIGEPADA